MAVSLPSYAICPIELKIITNATIQKTNIAIITVVLKIGFDLLNKTSNTLTKNDEIIRSHPIKGKISKLNINTPTIINKNANDIIFILCFIF